MEMVFNLPDRGEVRFDLPDAKHLSPAERIWQAYLRLHAQDLVARSGNAYCGVYPIETLKNFLDKPVIEIDETNRQHYTGKGIWFPEPVSLHAHSCCTLAFLLSQEFSELFCRDHSHEPSIDVEIVRSLYRLNNVFYFHDSAETVIGDIPDDHGDDDTKIQRELPIVVRNVALLGYRWSRSRIINDFVNFAYPRARDLYVRWTEFDGELAQIARVIDKAEAVLTCLRNEKIGHPGHLNHKRKFYNGISSQDQSYIDLCHTDQISDCWAAHFVDIAHDLYGFRPLIQVIHAAVLDIRDEWYPWWDDLCAKIQLDPKIYEPYDTPTL